MRVNRVKDIREEFIRKLKEKEFNEEGMLEITGSSFIADEPVIFGTINQEYVDREIEWYNSKSLRVDDLVDAPAIWKSIASSKGFINSNYGWVAYSEDNYNQYEEVLNKLKVNKNSRQAEIIYIRPSMHLDAVKDGMKDFMCTNAVIYRINGSKLDCTVQMRSNDVVYGFKNDYAWQYHILSKLAVRLNLFVGTIHWQVASLHIYQKHFKLI